MFLVLLSCTILSSLLSIWIKWRTVRCFWANKNVPFNKPHPIMGSLTFLQRENPAIFMERIYNQFQSPYVGIWLFWKPALVINSPALARHILIKDFDIFRNRFLSSGKSDPVGGLSLFTANDPLWSSMRRRLTSVFTASKLRALQSMTLSKSNDLVERLRMECQKGPIKDLRNILVDYTTDVIGEASFGVVSHAAKTGDSVIRKVTKDFMEYSTFRGLCWSSIFFWPQLVDVFGFSLFPKDTVELLRHIMESMTRARGTDRNVEDPKDLLDALIKIQKTSAAEGVEISDDIILAQAAIFVLGGFDTTGATLTWILLELANLPHIQDRLREEIVDAEEKNHGQPLDSVTLAALPFLNAVIKEALRKFPTMGWLDRIATQDYKVDDNLTIPAGTVVYVNAVGMHRDPKYYPDPEKFDPERFMPENEKDIEPFSYMPFGEGPRHCIGMRFAQQSMRFAVAAIFSNFEVKPVPGFKKPKDISYEHKGLLLMPGEDVSVILEPRS